MRLQLKTSVPLLGLFYLSLFSLSPQKVSAQITARYAHTSTLLPNGNILIVGGLTSTGGVLVSPANSVEVMVAASGNALASISPAGCGTNLSRSSHTATVLPNGNVLIAGGVSGSVALSSGVVYNPLTNSCLSFPAMTSARFHHTATLLQNGKVLIAGGQTDTVGAVTASVEVFDPGTGLFTAVGSMSTARAAHTATLLYNGLVFAAGGYGAGNQFLNTTELFNPASLTWTPGAALISARAFHTATAMGNRFVLIAGGFNGLSLLANKGILDVTEIYNPVSNTMMPPPPPMESRKMMHTATLQPDGTVDLYGGLGNITTSYMTGSVPLQSGSLLNVSSSAVGSVFPSTGVIQASSNLQAEIKTKLSVPVTGDIQRGQIYFFNPPVTPSIALQDASVYFQFNPLEPEPDYPTDTQFARLDGAYVFKDQNTGIAGQLDKIVTILPPSGTVAFSPQTLTSKDGVSVAGSSITITSPPCASGTTCVVNGGTLTIPIDIPMPKTDLGGTVITGSATIVGGSISNTTLGFAITFNGGTAFGVNNIDGGVVAADVQGNAHYVRTVTFNNLLGKIVNSTTTSISSPLNISNQSVTGLQLYIQYMVTPINVSGQSFTFSAATITIRSMIFGDQEIYDPGKNTWSFNPARGTPSFNQTYTLVPNGDALIFGGRRCDSGGSCATLVATSNGGGYVTALNPFPADASLNNPRSNHTSTLLPDGRVLVAGGTNGPQSLSSAEIYDPKAKTWAVTGFMNTPRAGHTATLLTNGTILVAGGYISNNSTSTTNTSEIYYPDTGRWVAAGVMVSPRQAHTATLLPDGTVLVAGGSSGGNYLNTSEIYYSTSATWSSTPTSMTLAAGRADHTATLLQDGRVLAVGGINAGGPTTSAEAYDYTTGQWSAVASMPTGVGRGSIGRFAHTATLLRNGWVLAAGGDDSFGEIMAPELYSPFSNTWTIPAFQVVDPRLIPGIDVGVPRLRHTAVLLPDGTIAITGGVTASGSSINSYMTLDPDALTWQELKGALGAKRGYHTSVLLNNGRILNVGGSDAPGSYLSSCDSKYYGPDRDAATPASSPPFSRIPAIVTVDSGTFNRGGAISVIGSNFKGVTEASGNGAASGDSSFHAPRIYLQDISASPSGFLEDISTAIYTNSNNVWSNVDSSITVALPSIPASLPYGWYHLRVAANAQFSDAISVQAGPPRPTMQPGVPTGVMPNAASVLWSWTAAPGCPNPGVCEGYHVYSSTNGVFLSTISAVCAGGTCQFLQSGLGSATVASIKVAAYNLTGDGPSVTAGSTFVTSSLLINGISGLAISTGTILWSWPSITGAVSYNVFSASSGTLLSVVPSNGFTEIGLATNTANSITVQANTGLTLGPLTASATIYTLAMPPAPAIPAVLNLSTSGFTAQWTANTNPPGTNYNVSVSTGLSAAPFLLSATANLSLSVSGLTPNFPAFIQVSALNGNGIPSAATLIAITYTLANPPINPVITGNSPSAVSIAWNANSNPGYTAYQITISTDNFQTSVSTPIPFSANYTNTNATISGLLTGPLYTIRIVAENQLGIQTAPAILSTSTVNGGGPLGSVSANISDPTQTTNISGSIGSGRAISVRIPSNAFSVPVTILISSASAVTQCKTGTLDAAISVTVTPPLQPVFPIQLGISFSPTEPGIGSPATLSMVRFDSPSNTCVPLQTQIGSAGTMAFATTNHLTIFQLAQVLPTSDLSAVRVYPNPLYMSSQGYMTFDRLPAGARVRIFTLRGEELFDQESNNSGILTWVGTNKSARIVGSGIYPAVVEFNGQKKILKLAVIR